MQRKKYEYQFFAFFEKIFLVTVLKTLGSIGMINTVLLISILLCITAFYFLWHMSKKCHKMPFLGFLWHFLTDAVKHRMS